MPTITKTISNDLVIRTDPVDDMILVRARWAQDPDNKHYSAFVPPERAAKVVKSLQKPDDLVNASIKIPKNLLVKYGGNSVEAIIMHKDAVPGKYYSQTDKTEPHPESMNDDIDPEHKVVFYNYNDETYYDKAGNILNRNFYDNVIGQEDELQKIIEASRGVDWMKVSGPIRYVQGNGLTISVEFTLTEDEYVRHVVNKDDYDFMERFLKEKGMEDLVPRKDNRDDEPDMDF